MTRTTVSMIGVAFLVGCGVGVDPLPRTSTSPVVDAKAELKGTLDRYFAGSESATDLALLARLGDRIHRDPELGPLATEVAATMPDGVHFDDAASAALRSTIKGRDLAAAAVRAEAAFIETREELLSTPMRREAGVSRQELAGFCIAAAIAAEIVIVGAGAIAACMDACTSDPAGYYCRIMC